MKTLINNLSKPSWRGMACIIRGPGGGSANSGGNMDKLYSMVGPNSF